MQLADAIVALYRAKGYRLAENPGEVNIVYLEGANEDGSARPNMPDQFNDRRILFGFAGGVPQILGNWSGTSEPGKFYTDNPLDHGGAARIALGQHQCVWLVGTHQPGSTGAHEALVQRATITIYRDLNRDYQRSGDSTVVGNGFGLNQHWGYNNPENQVGRASAGCLVGRTKKGHLEFMAIVKADPRYKADVKFKFDTAVIEAAELQPYLTSKS